ncbi:MAG: hypothetical protein LBQ30_03620 [Treponema sp.]|jgi:hypothetical protein|nr:hypothetical protein [Treponema sp.]
MTKKVAEESLGRTLITIAAHPALRNAGIRCLKSIFYHFFFLQYKAALLPGRIPITSVDHPLDARIPFSPRWVGIYLDFVAFWVRIIGFLLRTYRRAGMKPAIDFINSMGRLYAFAAQMYTKNLSTTNRPRYLAHPQFVLIHATDPHLMCIPSLHVLVVIRTYTAFRAIIRSFGDADRFAPQIEEVTQGAVAITQALLYVKQHSINCVAAGLYAMTCFEGTLFPREEAEDWVSRLFRHTQQPTPQDSVLIRNYIMERYIGFLTEAEQASSWEEPLLGFLHSCPEVLS